MTLELGHGHLVLDVPHDDRLLLGATRKDQAVGMELHATVAGREVLDVADTAARVQVVQGPRLVEGAANEVIAKRVHGELGHLRLVLAHGVGASVLPLPIGAAAGPQLRSRVLRGRQNDLLARVEQDGSDLLGVPRELLHRLLLLAVEEDHLAVDASGDDAVVVGLVHVEAEDARRGGLVRGVRAGASEPLHVRDRRQVGGVPLLARLGEALGDLGHARDDLRREPRLGLVVTAGCPCRWPCAGHRPSALQRLAELVHLLARGVALAQEPRDDTARGVVLVERVRQLLARGVEVRLQLVGL
mmetsp:Transcript_22591/g.51411  ORF Transcript_22591/g.51411 Transcript_22591/m.51411 type:complete len:301 (+) Transcript_22591:500-1402(+)